ncbi:MAG: phospho-sugar mutase [Bacilli bacterium]|nr:phospho-sugar mutase [Bacilli bacterium]
MEKAIKDNYERWLKKATLDPSLVEELEKMGEDTIYESFYRELEFGTGGLRGVIGAGTNRMNVYTVMGATQGLANYILSKNKTNPKAAISFDSRIKSDLFAKISAMVLSANGIHAYIYKELMPTPCLSFAVRELGCDAGIMVTASHNPSKYNGYKVYGPDGCQITNEAADAILASIRSIDVFEDVKIEKYEEAEAKGLISTIRDEVYEKFLNHVLNESVTKGKKIDKSAKIIYTPLHGTGLKPVTDILALAGFTNVSIVKEQELPDGYFTTCPYPNPEIREAMQLGIEYATKENADLLIATDPDCDRVGIAVKNKKGEFTLLTGNETGSLLIDFIIKMREETKTMPVDPVMVKTIVTTPLAEDIATKHGVKTINVLTGFKYIGEQIAALEKAGHPESYILGFEESYGYLTGTYVRDKDAVDGSLLIAEMFAYYKERGISLLDRLEELYKEYGHYSAKLLTYQFEGADGLLTMKKLMEKTRNGEFSTKEEIVSKIDYLPGVDGLPKADVLKFSLASGVSFIVRPSGTEPKLKIYLFAKGESKEANEKMFDSIKKEIEKVGKSLIG